MAGAGDIFAKLLLVRGEDADAAPPARNGHLPLLRVRRWLDGGIREQDVIHGLGRDHASDTTRTVRAFCVSDAKRPIPQLPTRAAQILIDAAKK